MELGWLGLLIIPVLYGMLRFVAQSQAAEEGSPRRKLFGILEATAVTFFIYFFSQLIGGLTIYIFLGLIGWDEARITSWLTNNTLGQFLVSAAIQLGMLGLLALFMKRRRMSFASIGWKGRFAWRETGLVIVAYLAYLALFIASTVAAKALFPSLDLEQKQEIGFDNVSQLQLPLVFVSLVILPPLVEEVIMRGYLYTSLKSQVSQRWAAIITSILFAVAHLQAGSSAPLLWIAAIDTFILSLLLIHLREKTGRLWAPIMLHALKNGIAFATLFIFKLA